MSRKAFFRARAGKPDANSAAIVGALRKLGYLVVSIRSSEDGAPDLAVHVRSADPVYLEVKTTKGRLRPAQTRWHERARSFGVRVHVIHSLDEALAVLQPNWRAVAEANGAKARADIDAVLQAVNCDD